jgi:hypothetical protein
MNVNIINIREYGFVLNRSAGHAGCTGGAGDRGSARRAREWSCLRSSSRCSCRQCMALLVSYSIDSTDALYSTVRRKCMMVRNRAEQIKIGNMEVTVGRIATIQCSRGVVQCRVVQKEERRGL